MKPGNAKRKGKSYENKIAKILHEWFIENHREYKILFEHVGNEDLKPKRDSSSGTFKDSTGDIDLRLLKKHFSYSVECKHWASLDFSLNQLINGKINSLIEIWKKQVVPTAKRVGLDPILVFSANRTAIFCMVKKEQILLTDLAMANKNFVCSYKYVIVKLEDFLEMKYKNLDKEQEKM